MSRHVAEDSGGIDVTIRNLGKTSETCSASLGWYICEAKGKMSKQLREQSGVFLLVKMYDPSSVFGFHIKHLARA